MPARATLKIFMFNYSVTSKILKNDLIKLTGSYYLLVEQAGA